MFRKCSHSWRGAVVGFAMFFGSVTTAFAQDRTPTSVLELPVAAQYCAILRALSSRPDHRCPDISDQLSQNRGLVITDPTALEVAGTGQTRAMVVQNTQIAADSGQINSLSRSFSHAAIAASGNPGEAGYFIQFAFDSADLGVDYQAHLARLVEVLKTDVMANSCVKIIGHTDTVGGPAYNLGLSGRRAQSVQSYMVATLGLAPDRLGFEGRGEASPLADIPGGHPKNRRVEILSRDLALGCS